MVAQVKHREGKTDSSAIQQSVAALGERLAVEIKRIDQVNNLQKESVGVALVAAEKAVNAALAAADKATEKAEMGTRESFAKVNEFRGALEDLGKTMATRRELEALRDTVVLLTSRLDRSPEIHALTTRADLTQGKSAGIGASMGFAQWAVLLASGLIGLYVALHGFMQ